MIDYDTPEIRCSLRNLSRVTEWLKGGAGRAEIFNALIGSDAYVVILPNFVFPFFVKGYMLGN